MFSEIEIEDLKQRVTKLEAIVAKLTAKSTPTRYRRCKAFLKQAGGDFSAAIALAKAANDDEAAECLADGLGIGDY